MVHYRKNLKKKSKSKQEQKKTYLRFVVKPLQNNNKMHVIDEISKYPRIVHKSPFNVPLLQLHTKTSTF